LAKGNGFSGGSISALQKNAENGNAGAARSDNAGSDIYSEQHIGGTVAWGEGIHSIFGNSTWGDGEIGIAVIVMCAFKFLDRFGYRISDGIVGRSKKNGDAVRKNYEILADVLEKI
jgi:hypothetical protein